MHYFGRRGGLATEGRLPNIDKGGRVEIIKCKLIPSGVRFSEARYAFFVGRGGKKSSKLDEDGGGRVMRERSDESRMSSAYGSKGSSGKGGASLLVFWSDTVPFKRFWGDLIARRAQHAGFLDSNQKQERVPLVGSTSERQTFNREEKVAGACGKKISRGRIKGLPDKNAIALKRGKDSHRGRKSEGELRRDTETKKGGDRAAMHTIR